MKIPHSVNSCRAFACKAPLLFFCALSFLIFASFALNSSASLSIENGPISNITRTTAISYATLTGTNGSTNAVSVILYYGLSDGVTNTADWSYARTNTFSSPSLPLAISNVLSSLTPAYHHYCRYYASQDTDTTWSATSTNFYTLAGTPTNSAPALYTAVMVDTNGNIVAPTNFIVQNGLATTNEVPTTNNIAAVQAELIVHTNRTDNPHAVTAAQTGALTSEADTNALAQLAIETNRAQIAEGAAFLTDGTRSGDRSVWGTGLNITNINISAQGATQYGKNTTTNQWTIGANSFGARQAGFTTSNDPSSQSIGIGCYGAVQEGGNANGTKLMDTGCIGSGQYGYNNDGFQIMGTFVYGGSQRCYNHGGLMVMANQAHGSMQNGHNDYGVVTNNGARGVLQLFYLTVGQTQYVTSAGHAGVILGAGTLSNKNSIVAGDDSVSHGDGSITASGGIWIGNEQVITNGANFTRRPTVNSTNVVLAGEIVQSPVRYQACATTDYEIYVLASKTGITANVSGDLVTMTIPAGTVLLSARVRWPGSSGTSSFTLNLGTNDMVNTSLQNRWGASFSACREDTGAYLTTASCRLDTANHSKLIISGLISVPSSVINHCIFNF